MVVRGGERTAVKALQERRVRVGAQHVAAQSTGGHTDLF